MKMGLEDFKIKTLSFSFLAYSAFTSLFTKPLAEVLLNSDFY
jgi:hypothetical protein